MKKDIKTRRHKSIKENVKRISIVAIALFLNALGVINSVYAANINSAYIYPVNDCGQLLTYRGMIVKTIYVEYSENGSSYPAYCMDKTKAGVSTEGYSVSIDSAISDVGLWRRIINGYPYKTIEELGVANKEEAFTATKQAIYCYIHNNNPDDYRAIGEAGQRTLNAMYKIIQNAQNSTESKVSTTITINKNDGEWKQDTTNKEYAYKVYSVSAGTEISNYKITLAKENSEDLGGIKLVDENNKERVEFTPNEKFKVLVPIKNMTEDGELKISVEAKIKTKPILYGTAPHSSRQDYALTGASYDDGTGETKDTYYKNETQIIILKQDQEKQTPLQGVEFELLNENKEVVYADLKTNEEGKIIVENLVPGKYYIKETRAIEGYQIYEELIPVEADFNQEVTVTINNNKEDKPEIETKTQKSKSVANKEIKKLPVTGM